MYSLFKIDVWKLYKIIQLILIKAMDGFCLANCPLFGRKTLERPLVVQTDNTNNPEKKYSFNATGGQIPAKSIQSLFPLYFSKT